MTFARPLRIVLFLACLLGLVAGNAFVASVAHAGEAPVPKELQHVGVQEHLDSQLPLDATFLDHTGKEAHLGDYFRGEHPVLLILAYHSCPVLCGMVQNAAATSMKLVPWTAGKDFEVVVISIDPRDTPQTAAEKRAGTIAGYGRDPEGAGFHFLVGKKGEIDRVANAAGFQYEYDERQGQYGHPAVIMLAKPNGQMARYLYGLEYDPKDLRFGLLEAASGRSTSTIEKVMLYCYRYDPQEGKYVPFARNLMRLGGGLTIVILGSFFALMFVRERKRSRALTDRADAVDQKEAPPSGHATETS